MLNHDVRRTQLKIQRRLQLIQDRIYRQSVLIPPFRILSLDSPLVPPPLDADSSGWDVIEPNSYWGAKHQNFALASTFTIPATFDPASPVALFLDLGDGGDFDHPEALIYIDGQPYMGVDKRHHEIRLPEHLRDGREHRLLLHGWCGLLGGTQVPAGRKLHMKFSSVVQVDQPTRAFIAAARSAWTAAVWLEVNHPSKAWLFNALEEAFKILDTRDPLGDAFYASVPAAHEALCAGVEKAGTPLDVHIAAAGHAHIDTAWLWSVDQTRRKAERSFSNVLRLMEEFPEFNFVQSQPQLYEWICQDQPVLFEQIKRRIAERRWEPIGGMWIEADCNLSGAESLARQFVLGRSFFRRHFGAAAESPVLWLPDVFGYAWNLPQLIKQAGLEYFFTIKIGWNQYNHLPYDSFWWQGLDGTRVLTHFSTAPEASSINSRATYNAEVDPMISLGAWINYQGKHLHNEMLMSYGWGDGGGGPTREMIENIRELDRTPGIPQVRPSLVVDFFRRLESQAGDRLPTWNGELYLEAHRGTYTTQARNKRWNRKSELRLHDAEFLATVASMMDDSYIYPHDAFRKAWEIVCLHQFHDILPGSSITEVYTDSAKYYAQVADLVSAAQAAALEVIKQHMGGDLLLINPSGSYNTDLIAWKGALPAGSMLEGENHTLIFTQHGETETALRCSGGLPRLTIEPISVSRDDTGEMQESADDTSEWIESSPTCLDNGRIRVEFNAAGDITRIFHHTLGREVLPAGAIANQFQAFEDRPNDWDAWDVDIFFEDRMTLAQPAESARLIEGGSLRRTLEIRRKIQHSDYVQYISLAADSAAIDFDTTIEWREKHTLLKVAFPVDVLTTKATHEVQWGNVERPTTRNSSWDWARFETCAHKWVMLEESGFGAALINDCKYGHDVKDNVIRLSLLRAPTNPDAHADEGTHTFKYRFLVDTDLFDTVQSAYTFNDPAFVVQGNGSPRLAQPLTFIEQMYTEFDHAQVQVETIKRAEDNNGVIVRLYEYGRTRGNVTIEFGFPIREAYRANLLEENQAKLQVLDSAAVRLFIKPFEIITLRLIPDFDAVP